MAAGDLQVSYGTPIVFGSEVGDDVSWSTESIGTGAGRQSAQWDRTSQLTNRYKARFYVQNQATPTLGNTIDVYLKTGDSSTLHLDNDDGTGDIAVSSIEKLRNLTALLSAVVDEAAADIEFVRHVAEVVINANYVHMVMWNAAGSTTTSDASECKLELTPVIYSIAQS